MVSCQNIGGYMLGKDTRTILTYKKSAQWEVPLVALMSAADELWAATSRNFFSRSGLQSRMARVRRHRRSGLRFLSQSLHRFAFVWACA